jgi:hypothetical protein
VTHDFIRSFHDLQRTSFSDISFNRIIFQISITTVKLKCFITNFETLISCNLFRKGAVSCCRWMAFINQFSSMTKTTNKEDIRTDVRKVNLETYRIINREEVIFPAISANLNCVAWLSAIALPNCFLSFTYCKASSKQIWAPPKANDAIDNLPPSNPAMATLKPSPSFAILQEIINKEDERMANHIIFTYFSKELEHFQKELVSLAHFSIPFYSLFFQNLILSFLSLRSNKKYLSLQEHRLFDTSPDRCLITQRQK